MQQLNSLYRGDQSDSLSNIMGMQYAPQAQLNKFTGDMAMTGMSLANATNRTAMQLASQEGIERNRLREQIRSTNLSNMLGMRNSDLAEARLGMDMNNQQFNQQKDVATFNQTKENNAATQAYNSAMLALNTVKANEPNIARDILANKEKEAAGANWSVWEKNAGFVRGLLQKQFDDIDPTKVKIGDIKAMNEALAKRDAIRQRLGAFDKHVGWASEEYKKRGASFLQPFFSSRFGSVDSLYDIAGLGMTPYQAPATTAKTQGRKDE